MPTFARSTDCKGPAKVPKYLTAFYRHLTQCKLLAVNHGADHPFIEMIQFSRAAADQMNTRMILELG
jgi:hypothetical protein